MNSDLQVISFSSCRKMVRLIFIIHYYALLKKTDLNNGNNMKSLITKIAIVTTLTTAMTGCIGSNAVTSIVMKFNLEAVDNRYARGGLNMLLAPVYGLTATADVIVFNSIEFWSGKNVINGKPHIFDMKTKTIITINDDLDPSLTTAPLDPLTNVNTPNKDVYSTQINTINEDTLDFNIVYTNGDKATLRGEKQGEIVNFYMDGQFVTTVSIAELEQHSLQS